MDAEKYEILRSFNTPSKRFVACILFAGWWSAHAEAVEGDDTRKPDAWLPGFAGKSFDTQADAWKYICDNLKGPDKQGVQAVFVTGPRDLPSSEFADSPIPLEDLVSRGFIAAQPVPEEAAAVDEPAAAGDGAGQPGGAGEQLTDPAPGEQALEDTVA